MKKFIKFRNLELLSNYRVECFKNNYISVSSVDELSDFIVTWESIFSQISIKSKEIESDLSSLGDLCNWISLSVLNDKIISLPIESKMRKVLLDRIVESGISSDVEIKAEWSSYTIDFKIKIYSVSLLLNGNDRIYYFETREKANTFINNFNDI